MTYFDEEERELLEKIVQRKKEAIKADMEKRERMKKEQKMREYLA